MSSLCLDVLLHSLPLLTNFYSSLKHLLKYYLLYKPQLWCWKRLLGVPKKDIKPVNPKGNQPWILMGRTGAAAEALIIWPPDMKSRFIEDPGAGKDWRQEEKGMTVDEMVGWHHQLDGHELEQTLWDSEGQGSLACCSLWSCKELDTT